MDEKNKLLDIKSVDEIAERIYDMACDMDFADYEDTKEEEIEQLKNALYYLKSIAQNEYNPKHFRTLYNALQCI